jgi:transcription initiation factor TFIIIB Brf1 subunit/transcription initiation factor TFIIB
MAAKKKSASELKRAEARNQEGLQAYAEWDIEVAVERFRSAIKAASEEPEYHLNLAKALSRALRALAEFLRLEPDSEVAERFERLFASGLDEVEGILTEKMAAAEMPIEVIGAAMQMWLEYRIAIGRAPLVMRKPETWSAALDYAVRKVNLREVTQQEMADLYGVSERTLRQRFEGLVVTLDVMPCDYRYFAGDQNPLDKLVEAAELLEKLETGFREP